MPAKFNKNSIIPLLQLVRSLLGRFLQTTDAYPIKYYKKGKHPKKLNFF